MCRWSKGPLSGGVADLDALTELHFDPTGKPAHWVLHQDGQAPLAIPVSAEGADALFDSFAALPGFHTERMLSAMNGPPTHAAVLWQKEPRKTAHLRLH